jgi:transketolase
VPRFRKRAAEFARRIAGDLPATFVSVVARFESAQAAKGETVATRKASQQAIEAFAAGLPELIGGSADLTGSVFTNWSGSKVVAAGTSGNYLNFGVREFAMSAIANGLALHGGFIPYVGTFLTFSDYARNALRMASLMKLRSIFVYTHDSIGLGEDGPTHQSIEHASSLRLIPGMDLWRPCDTVESAVRLGRRDRAPARPDVSPVHSPELPVRCARHCCVRRHRARRLCARRLRCIDRGFARGDHRDRFRSRACARRARRAREGRCRRARGLDAVHERVRATGRGVPRIGASLRRTACRRRGRRHGLLAPLRRRRRRPKAAVVGIDTFGESAPAPVLFKHFGFTVDNVVAAVRKVSGK